MHWHNSAKADVWSDIGHQDSVCSIFDFLNKCADMLIADQYNIWFGLNIKMSDCIYNILPLTITFINHKKQNWATTNIFYVK